MIVLITFLPQLLMHSLDWLQSTEKVFTLSAHMTSIGGLVAGYSGGLFYGIDIDR